MSRHPKAAYGGKTPPGDSADDASARSGAICTCEVVASDDVSEAGVGRPTMSTGSKARDADTIIKHDITIMCTVYAEYCADFAILPRSYTTRIHTPA